MIKLNYSVILYQATPTKKDTAQTIEVPAPRRRLSIEEVNFDEDEIEKTDTKKDNEVRNYDTMIHAYYQLIFH